MKTKLEFLQAGSEVVRYHTITTLVKETVGHHSHGVAMICMILDPSVRGNVLRAALLHDLPEHVTGDIPSPAKRIHGIGAQVKSLEADLMCQAGFSERYLEPREQRLLKLADLAQGAMFCAREITLGNRKMSAVMGRYLEYARAMNLSGVEKELFNIIEDMAK
jgi:5'-deoxynucleotidase YfbR-like HD superfamily hydrolase